MGRFKQHEPSRGPNSNRLDLIPEPLRSEVVKVCHERCYVVWEEWRSKLPPCSERNHACYICQDTAAARLRDSDGSPKGGDGEAGSVACDDSAGPKDIAQPKEPS